MKNLFYKLKAPCNKCPYKLGHVQTLVNPCPQCKLNDYRTFKEFKNQMLNKDKKIM